MSDVDTQANGAAERVDLTAMFAERTELDDRTLSDGVGSLVVKQFASALADLSGAELADQSVPPMADQPVSVARLSVTDIADPVYLLISQTALDRIAAALFSADETEIYAAEQPLREEGTRLDDAIAKRVVDCLSKAVARLLEKGGTYELLGLQGDIKRLSREFFSLSASHITISLGHSRVDGGAAEIDVLVPKLLAEALTQRAMEPAKRMTPKSWQHALLEAAMTIPLEISASIARLNVPMSKLSAIGPGDDLAIASADFARLEIDGTDLGISEVGDQNGQKAIRIMSFAPDRRSGATTKGNTDV